jgi:hypothetical protein
MDNPLAGAMLSQLTEGAKGFDIVCGCAVQLNDPEPWLDTVNGCEGGVWPPAMAEKTSPDCESVNNWAAWLTASVTFTTADAVESAACTVMWPV